MNNHVKLCFSSTNCWDEDKVESMWAIRREDGYEIDNIPFYVTGVAVGDIVSAEPDADGLLWYSRLVRASGHSTIQIWFANEDDVPRVRQELLEMSCTSEGSDRRRLISVDVPLEVPYGVVKAFLDRGEEAGTFKYQEACLGFL